jgi:ABC-type nitrate/sulfonate/bicarbonate transport system substrate-binding protein
MDQKQKKSTITRRNFLKGGLGACVAVAGFPYVARSQQLKKMKITAGTILTSPSGAIELYRAEHKLVEKYARQEGYDLEVIWRDFPYGGIQVEAMLSGKLDISNWADIVQTRLISQNQPVHPINIMEGRQNFCINVRPDSPIRNVEDLKGKTIGTILGTVFHGLIVNLFRTELGTADLNKLGVKLVNIPSVAQLMTMPTGIDAASNNIIFTLKGEMEGHTKSLITAHGKSGTHYKGPAGEGPGLELPNFRKAPWYPEAYYPFRLYNLATRKLIQEHPKLIKAFIMASEQAVRDLKKMTYGEISQTVNKFWKLPPKEGAVVAGDVLPLMRGWTWLTEGDAGSISEVSKFMAETGALPKPLSSKEVKANVEIVMPIMKEAYAQMGNTPDLSVFTDKGAIDIRGLPLWMIDKWS